MLRVRVTFLDNNKRLLLFIRLHLRGMVVDVVQVLVEQVLVEPLLVEVEVRKVLLPAVVGSWLFKGKAVFHACCRLSFGDEGEPIYVV